MSAMSLSVSINTLSQIELLAPSPSCVFQALENILPHCKQVPNDQNHVWIAIQLVCCEYSTAKLQLPPQCSDESQMLSCLQALESRPQWWTSYTAYHQTIRTICVEYQPRFEMQNAVRFYRNLTRIVDSYQQNLSAAYSELMSMHNLVATKTSELLGLERLVESLNQRLKAMHEDLDEQADRSMQQVQAEWSVLRTQTNQMASLNQHLLEEMASSLYMLSSYDGIVQAQLESTVANISKVGETLEDTARKIQAVQLSALELAVNTSEVVESTLSRLDPYISSMLHVFTVVAQLSRVVLILVCIYMVRAVYRLVLPVTARTSTLAKSSQALTEDYVLNY